MSDETRVARVSGVNGTFEVEFGTAPTAPPTLTIYSDLARTVVAVASQVLTATANPNVWTATYPATLPAALFFLEVFAVYTVGQPARRNANDELLLEDPAVAVSAGLVDLAETREYLSVGVDAESELVNTAHDGVLASLILAATPVIEDACGPVLPATVTETYPGGRTSILLDVERITAVLSVEEAHRDVITVLTAQTFGATPDDGYLVDLDSRKITRTAGGWPRPFPPGPQAVRVTYRAGFEQVPEHVRQAALELVRHWFYASQGGQRAFGGADADGQQLARNYGVPYAVLNILAGVKRKASVL